MRILLSFFATVGLAGALGCGSDAMGPTIDAAPTIDVIYSTLNEVCGHSDADLDAGAHGCDPGVSLACCPSCTDPGCTDKCTTPCSSYTSGCSDGCMH